MLTGMRLGIALREPIATIGSKPNRRTCFWEPASCLRPIAGVETGFGSLQTRACPERRPVSTDSSPMKRIGRCPVSQPLRDA
jgi:hypothetical protein